MGVGTMKEEEKVSDAPGSLMHANPHRGLFSELVVKQDRVWAFNNCIRFFADGEVNIVVANTIGSVFGLDRLGALYVVTVSGIGWTPWERQP
jgi:hypothetical protein